jgi:hypothetical protein
MPGYGIAGPGEGRLLPWSWARDRLTRAHNYFVATTRPEGRPHLMPVWGVWHSDCFYFSTGAKSRKARNLAANPNCVVSPEGGKRAVIVEGIAKRVRVTPALRPVRAAYRAKYGMDLDPSLGPILRVTPRVAFGFIESETEFTTTATRWTF